MLALHVKGSAYLKWLNRSLNVVVKKSRQNKCSSWPVVLSYNQVEYKPFIQPLSRLLCQKRLLHTSGNISVKVKERESSPRQEFKSMKVSEDEKRLGNDSYKTIYLFRNIVPYQVLSRMKIYQSVGTIVYLLASMSTGDIGTIFDGTFLVFCVSSSISLLVLFAASWHLKKFVGLIALNNSGDQIKLAHITYWGKRENLLIPVDNLVCPLQADGHKYVIRLKNSSDIFYVVPSKASYYNSFLIDKVFGNLKDVNGDHSE